MKPIRITVMAAMLAVSATALAAEYALTFNPAASPGGSAPITQWDEKDIRLAAPAGNMDSRDYNYAAWQPSNGTAFASFKSTSTPGPAVLTNTAGATFSLRQVDLAEYSSNSILYADVEFIGFRRGGSTVTNTFFLDGTIDGEGPLDDWETFTFSAGFTNLTHVEIRQAGTVYNRRYSIDNLWVGTIVTNPASIAGIATTGGVATLTVSDLSTMASNLVERSHDLLQSNWTAAGWFVSSNATQQWSEPISNSWTKVFYRVRSR